MFVFGHFTSLAVLMHASSVYCSLDFQDLTRQLRCSGVLETIRIRQGGFPNRRELKAFVERYRILAKESVVAGDAPAKQ